MGIRLSLVAFIHFYIPFFDRINSIFRISILFISFPDERKYNPSARGKEKLTFLTVLAILALNIYNFEKKQYFQTLTNLQRLKCRVQIKPRKYRGS